MARPFEWENRNALLVQTGANEVRTRPGGVPKWIRDATEDDNDKTFIVPVGKMWYVVGIYVELTATATEGNRRLNVIFGDGTSPLDTLYTNTDQEASSSVRYHIGPNVPNLTNDLFGTQYKAMFEHYLPSGYTIRVYDANNVDVQDDMIVIIHVIEYDS